MIQIDQIRCRDVPSREIRGFAAAQAGTPARLCQAKPLH
jgi:hypothetical protein